MSETASGATSADGAVGSGATKNHKGTEQKPGLFARIALFVRQVISEIKKVVAPTRSQLINYSIVVTVFVLLVMAYVMLVDFLSGKVVFAVFG